MHEPERVRVPRLTSRTGLVWGVGTLAVLVVGAVVLAVVDPANAPVAGAVAVVALLLAAAAGSTRRCGSRPSPARSRRSSAGRLSTSRPVGPPPTPRSRPCFESHIRDGDGSCLD